MPPIPSKSQFVGFVMIVIGIVCHIKGLKMSDASNASITQLVGMLFDALGLGVQWVVYLHNKNATAIATHVSEPAALAHPPATPSGLTGSNIAKLAILGFLLSTVTGCASFNQLSDQDKVSQSETIYTTAVMALNAAKTANLIDAQDFHTIVGIEQTISAAFDQVHADLDAGGKLDGNTAWSVINTMLSQITAYQWRFTHGTSNSGGNRGPTTIPSSRGSIGGPVGKQGPVTDCRTTDRYRNTA